MDDGHVLHAGAHNHADRLDDRHGVSSAGAGAGRQHRPKRLVHARLQHRGLKAKAEILKAEKLKSADKRKGRNGKLFRSLVILNPKTEAGIVNRSEEHTSELQSL